MYIETRSGLFISPLTLKPEEIKLNDVIASASKLCRFNGHCKHFYSVLTHSVNCCLAAEKQDYDFETCRYSLLHDALESVVGDLPSPYREFLPDFCSMEEKVETIFEDRFQIKGEYLLMKAIDRAMCRREARFLMRSKGKGERWEGDYIRLKIKNSELYGLDKPVFEDIINVFRQKCKEYKVK